ncbi:MAG TPA: OmpA family protein, partial [Geobacteraceae bacterium]|nr:OmpA family protein [Geobacteraceae bacterium]
MMKKIAALILTVAVSCITAAPVAAGERAGAISLSPFVGGYTFDGVQHLRTAPVYGLRLGIDLTKNWGVEAVGDYAATKGTRAPKESINALSYPLDIIYNIMPDGPFVPYLAIGGGGITSGHGDNGLKIKDSTTDATANAGLGFKYFLSDSVALRGDARQLFIFVGKHESTMYNWEYTAGLTFLFGGKTAPAPVPPPKPAPTSNLSVTPGSITKGEQATLSWTSQDATNCDINQGIGPVKPQGSMTITPSADTAYYLSCNGPGGTSNSTANITVAAPMAPPAPTSSMSVTPPSIAPGESATLNWNALNVTNCDLQPGIGPVKPQGSMSIKPSADTAYTLACSGPGGTTSSTANVVVAPPCPVVLHPEKEETVNLLIEFDFNKSVIKPEFYPNVNAVGEFMQKYPTVDITVEGHTDSVGKQAYNQKLSQRRAEAVKKYIVDKFGIDARRARLRRNPSLDRALT